MLLDDDPTMDVARVVLHGFSGTGKTTLLTELAKHFPVVVFDLENGKSIWKKLPPEARARVKYQRILDTATDPIGQKSLYQFFKKNRAQLCALHGRQACPDCVKEKLPINRWDVAAEPPETIWIIDSIAQLSNSILAHIVRTQDIDYKPERDDWGALRKHTEFYLTQWQNFPGLLACTTHPMEVKMEDGNTKLVPGFGSSKQSAEMARVFSEVIYTTISNRKHAAYSDSTAFSNIITKSRNDFRIEDLEVPSLAPLFDPGIVLPKKKALAIPGAKKETNASVAAPPSTSAAAALFKARMEAAKK